MVKVKSLKSSVFITKVFFNRTNLSIVGHCFLYLPMRANACHFAHRPPYQNLAPFRVAFLTPPPCFV
ncbi:hypothetical protein EC528_07430 [Helicobacter pylori]|nr:hypothetical protein EC528_07430 [Helicobacter pylori]